MSSLAWPAFQNTTTDFHYLKPNHFDFRHTKTVTVLRMLAKFHKECANKAAIHSS